MNNLCGASAIMICNINSKYTRTIVKWRLSFSICAIIWLWNCFVLQIFKFTLNEIEGHTVQAGCDYQQNVLFSYLLLSAYHISDFTKLLFKAAKLCWYGLEGAKEACPNTSVAWYFIFKNAHKAEGDWELYLRLVNFLLFASINVWNWAGKVFKQSTSSSISSVAL